MANAKSALEKVNKEFGIKSSSTSQKNDKRKQSTSVSSSETKSTNKNAKTALEKVNKEFGVGKYSNHTSVGNTTSRHIDEINRHLANAGLDYKETPPATSIDQIFEDNVGYVAEKFGRGIVDGLESMTDFGWNVVGGLGWGLTSAFGLSENKLSDAIADWTADIQTDDIVDYFEAPEDKYQYASDEVKKYGWLPETIGNIGASVGTGALIKGLGLAGQYGDDAVKLGTTAYDKVSKFLTNPQTLFGASAAGSAAEEATEKGANPIQSTIYGGLTGAMEVGTEKIFPGVADSVVGKTFVNFTSKAPVVNKALSILGEGAEEMIMTGIEPSLKRITGVDTNAQHATWADYVESGKHGMILSAVMGVANMPIQNYNRSKAVKELNVATEAINELTVADAPKLQPLPINASEKAIEARQAEIKAFAKAYNTFVAQNVEAESTPDTLERDVVEKRSRVMTPETARTTPVSEVATTDDVLPTRTETELKTATMPSYESVETPSAEIPSVQPLAMELAQKDAEATDAAYKAGKMNVPRESITLETPAQEEAYNKGRIEYIKNMPTEKSTETVDKSTASVEKTSEINIDEDLTEVEWTVPGKETPIAYSSESARDYIRNIADEYPTDTISELIEAVAHNDEMRNVLQQYVDAGYGNRIASEFFASDEISRYRMEGEKAESRATEKTVSKSDERVTVEEVKKATAFGEEGSKLVAELVNNEGLTIREAERKIKTAYLNGFRNNESAKVETNGLKEAFEAGQKDRAMQDASKKAESKNATTYNGVFTENEYTKKFTKAEKKMIAIFAKALRMDISVVDKIIASVVDGKTYEANASHLDGKMEISSTAEKVIHALVMHEGGHRMSQLAPEEFGVLMDALYERAVRRASRSGASPNAVFNYVKAEHDAAGITEDTRDYIEEIAVRELETIFGSAREFNKWYAEISGNKKVRTAWERIVDFFLDIVDELKRAFKQTNMTQAERAYANAELNDIKARLANAFKASENAATARAKEAKAKAETKAETKADTKIVTEATSKPVARENKPTDKETSLKAKNKPKAEIRRPKVGEVYKANATGKTYTITERNDTHTTYTVTDNNGKTTTRTVTNSAADANFNRKGKEGFTRVEGSKGIKAGDVFTAGKETYKIVSRDDKNTTVEISSEEGTKTMVISNEIADRNFSNISKDGITKWIDEADHIDNRDWDEVGDRKVKAFQFLFPEMQEYYKPLAQELIGDLNNTIQGERMLTGSYEMGNQEWTGVDRFTSEAIATIKDSSNATYDDIRNALNRLIEDKGQENIALAKRIELVFDDMLTKGYKTFDGMEIPPNEEYITKKEALIGKTYEKYEPSELDEDLPFFSLKDKKTDTKSTKNLEIKINEEYNGSGRYSLKNTSKDNSVFDNNSVLDKSAYIGYVPITKVKMKTFPPYNESKSDSNEWATRWAHRDDVETGAQTLVFYHNRCYVIGKYDSADLKYQIEGRISYSAYESIRKELEEDARNREKQSQKKMVDFLRERNERRNTDEGRGQSIDYSSVKHGREDRDILRLGRKQNEKRDLSSDISRSDEYDSQDRQTESINGDTRFSLKKPVEQTKNLVAVHNMQLSELERTLDLGGLPMPSIAIIKAQSGHSEYGNVSLVFNKETIDPKSNKANKVYGGDAWTPTYPKIEYKPNNKIANKISDKYYELSRKYGYDEIRPLYNYVHDLENQLNRNKGEAGMLEELYNDTRVMQFYLLDSGKGKIETINKETRTELTDAEVKMHEFFIKELGADVVDEVMFDGKGTPMEHRQNYMTKYGDAIREAYKKLLIQDYQFSEEEVQNVLDSTKTYNYMKFVRDAYNYRKNGRVTVKTEPDNNATENAIKEAAGEDYRKWVDSLFKGVEEKSGIRNNADYFTNSGNRRSWEALHWENNLENVVKVMKGQDDVGGSAIFAGHNIWGVAAKNYGSIAEIKADSDRLKQLPQEEYEKIKRSFGERLEEIAQSIMDKSERNPFIASDNAMECIVEAVRNSKTKSGVLNNLKQYRHLTITETTVDDIVSLVADISNMPTEYFEAKPKRAVELNEIATAIIPDSTSKETKQRLDDMGIKYIEYESGNEDARLEALNSLEELKFSLKGGVSTSELFDTVDDAKKGNKRAIDKLSKYVEDRVIPTELYNELLGKYGAIEEGENPHREVTVPKKTAKDKKVSMTVRTILEAKVTPDEAVPTIEKMVEDGVFSYDVYTDKEAINNAENYIKEYGWEASLVDWFDAVNKGEVSKDLTTTGWALYNNAANKAATATTEKEKKTATQTAIRILDAMVRHQRSAAQALQATRILKKMSPEAQLYGVQRSVESLRNELKEKYGKTAPDLKIDEALAEKFLDADTEEARLEAEKAIYKDIGRQMPSSFMDKWNAWRYLAMLGNPRTHVRNIFGNAFFAPVVSTKNLVATGIESMVAPVVRLSGKEMLRGKKLVFGSKADRALLKAAWNDYSNVADAVSNGGKYNDSAMANKHIDEGRKIFKSKLFAPVEWARKKNSKALETEDVWFSKPHYAYALAQYCKANNITPEQIQRGKAIAPAREYAIKEAQKATYKDTNAFSQFVSSLGRTSTKKNVITKGASAVVEGILPFRKTPANILVRGVEYSPLGLVKGLTRDLYKVSKGEMNAYEAIDNISAGLTGTGLLALGVYLAAQGLIRGHGEDEEKEKGFKEMMGHQAYSLELPNGQSITLDWLAPEALPFFVGVNIWEQTKGKNEKVNMASILQAVTGISEPMLEMSCLQGVNDLIEGVGYASSNGMSGLMAVLSSATTSYLMQGIPTLSGQAERTSEEERMTTYTEKNSFLTGDMQYLLGKASAKIPGWDYNQIPYIDAWGRKEASGSALKRGLNNFLNPAYTSTIESSDMEKELLRLHESTGEASVFPSRADKYFMIDGVRKDLTADEYVRYATLKGEKSYQMVMELVESEAYQKLTDAEKVKAIEEVYDYANQKAKEAISNYKPQSWVGEADDFENPENYLAFRSAVNDDMSKQDVVDIIIDMAENDTEAWDMYLSEYDSKAAIEARNDGVDADVFMEYSVGVSKADEDGSLTKEEVVDVITGMDIDNDDAWTLYLGKYDSKSAIEAEKHGIDAKLFMTATVDMSTIKADYNSAGKAISGSRRAKIERYLNSVCSSYKEYLFLLGTEYSSVKNDHDYIRYFGN